MPRFPFSHVSPPGSGRILVAALAFAALCLLSIVIAPAQAVGAVVAQVDMAPVLKAQAEAADSVIWNDASLRLICIAGSIGGALLSVLLFPPTSARAMAGKMTASVLSGGLFTPVIIRWADIVPDADVLLCSAAVVALMSWSLLLACIPIAQNFARKWMQIKFPEDNDKPPQP